MVGEKILSSCLVLLVIAHVSNDRMQSLR